MSFSYRKETQRLKREKNVIHKTKQKSSIKKENIDEIVEVDKESNASQTLIKRKRNEIQKIFDEKKEFLISSMQLDISHFVPTAYMFFDVEYFDNNIQIKNDDFRINENWKPKTQFYPVQFTLTNFFGVLCLNEWIYYDADTLDNISREKYFSFLNRRNVNYQYGTCSKKSLEVKIETNMKGTSVLIGYGIFNDVVLLKCSTGIDLYKYQLADLSKHPSFRKQLKKENNSHYPESFRILSQVFLKVIIQKMKGNHDAREDCETIRKLFWHEYDRINLPDLFFNKLK